MARDRAAPAEALVALTDDIKAPLASLVLLADAVAGALGDHAGREGADVTAARRFAGRITHEVERLNRLVGELVSMAAVAEPAERQLVSPAAPPLVSPPVGGGVKALVVDADAVAVDALGYLLRQEGFDVVEAETGADALARFEQVGADVVLLDVALPDITGLEVCRELRKLSPVPIIMVSTSDSEVDKVLGLELGADDYVTKPFGPRELVARIRAILRRREPLPKPERSDALAVGPVRLDASRHTVSVRGEAIRLRLKEFELLALLLRNAGRVLTRGQLIDRVWGTDYVGDTKTLDVHIKRLRDKLELDPSEPHHVVTVRGLGYKFEP